MTASTSPLLGARVLVTRPKLQSRTLCDALRNAGATPVVLPLLQMEPADATSDAWDVTRTADWVVFTSANGVTYGWQSAPENVRAWLRDHARVAAVGPATARAAEAHGVTVHLIAPEHVAESLADTLGDVSGKRILWIRGAEARDVLPTTLGARGARVDEIIVYRSSPAPISADARRDAESVDVVTLTSPSTVRQYVATFGATPSAKIVCLGPVTADAARALGLPVDAVADPYTVEGLMAAMTHLPLPTPRVA